MLQGAEGLLRNPKTEFVSFRLFHSRVKYYKSKGELGVLIFLTQAYVERTRMCTRKTEGLLRNSKNELRIIPSLSLTH